ncbi:hypothetical protein BU23DRAFT_48660 [Bimuria novae-zelandiae CBS 107.79]|uniref:Uncharacterized protein n=1 Tax=Bimuria novae-zelandiae CBS 107.79 TaxID=1447943 RepID=A0A6A5UJL1_9PLEO|nr:hypothetical protein BU23DRAFT_48660 [Bimuria novae-zelandiae CBS 107.79]
MEPKMTQIAARRRALLSHRRPLTRNSDIPGACWQRSAARAKLPKHHSSGQTRCRADLQADVFAFVRDWLRDERRGKWLLVPDNTDDASASVVRPLCRLLDVKPHLPVFFSRKDGNYAPSRSAFTSL